MTALDLINSPVAAAIPPALAGALHLYFRYRLALRRLELGCASCPKAPKGELPTVAPMIMLLLSVGAGMYAWGIAPATIARAAGQEQPAPGQKPAPKTCDPPCGSCCSCVNGRCQGSAEGDRKPRRAEHLLRSPLSDSSPPSWQDREIQIFADRASTL